MEREGHLNAQPPWRGPTLAYVLGPDKGRQGIAFCVGGRRFVTCAHVVAEALGRGDDCWKPKDAFAGRMLRLHFFETRSELAEVDAIVADWRRCVHERDAEATPEDHRLADVAVLDLSDAALETLASPKFKVTLHAARLEAPEGLRPGLMCDVFGSSEGGVVGEAQISYPSGGRWIALHKNGAEILPGFSGGAMVARPHGGRGATAVVGMVVRAHGTARQFEFIPFCVLKEVLGLGTANEATPHLTDTAGTPSLVQGTSDPTSIVPKPASRVEESAPTQALSDLPDRNPFFTGRQSMLAQIRQALADRGRAALTGLGGVGKTQTALEYAYEFSTKYKHFFWVNAESPETLRSNLTKIAVHLKLAGPIVQDHNLAVDMLKRWLTSHQNWLLILDNADDLQVIRNAIPPGSGGHVLLTTRASAVGKIARDIEVRKLNVEEGALLLLRRAKCIIENAFWEDVAEGDRATATEISRELGGLPLALEQAGAYIEETRCGLLEYLKLYREKSSEILKYRGSLTLDDGKTVASTWNISFDNVKKSDPIAADLLNFCAFLYPDTIPEEIFRAGEREVGPELSKLENDALALNKSISETLKYSLLRRNSKTSMVEIHRLVQVVLKHDMHNSEQRLWAERAVRALNHNLPTSEFSNWLLRERLSTQFSTSVSLIEEWSFNFSEAADLLHKIGEYLAERSLYRDSEFHYQRALRILEQTLGSDHPDVISILTNLASLHRVQGPARHADAERLFRRVLDFWERTRSPECPEAGTVRHELAVLYHDQHRRGDAEQLFLQALSIRERALGSDHPDVAWTLQNLAGLYRSQRRYRKAEPLYRKALAIQVKTLDPKTPIIAHTLNDLAALLRDTNRPEDAEQMFQQALSIQTRLLGHEHSAIATTLNDQAVLYRNQHRHVDAERLFLQALSIRERVLGPDHPDLATSLEDYARLLRTLDRAKEAAPLVARAKAIRANAKAIQLKQT